METLTKTEQRILEEVKNFGSYTILARFITSEGRYTNMRAVKAMKKLHVKGLVCLEVTDLFEYRGKTYTVTEIKDETQRKIQQN